MNEAKPFGVLIGERVKSARLADGQRQEDLASKLQAHGLNAWTSYTVTAVEVGRRIPDFAELPVLCEVLHMTLLELLAGECVVRMPGGAEQPLWALRYRMLGPPDDDEFPGLRTVSEGFEQALPLGAPPVLNAERKAARKLGVSPVAIAQTARTLWGLTLSEERDRRVAEQSPAVDDPRALRALRGHVTRQLLSQLAPALPAPKQEER